MAWRSPTTSSTPWSRPWTAASESASAAPPNGSRLPVMALPAWRTNRTQPIDGRDVTELLARAAVAPRALTGRSWDAAGPEAVTYAELIARIADAMMVARPTVSVNLSL